MRKIKLVSAVLALAGCFFIESATVDIANASGVWKCSAKDLANYKYSGGKKAYIHLKAYRSGGRYSVTRQSENKVAGKTKDGTPFSCTRQ